MKNFKQSSKSPIGTSFHDSVVVTTVNKLKQVLGKPHFDDNDGRDKINFEWRMELADGNVFTVYDYKEYRKLDLNELIEWHIGGMHPDVTERAKVCIELELNNIKDAWDAVIDNYKSTVLSHWHHFEQWDEENQSLLNFLKEYYDAPIAKPVAEKPVLEEVTTYTTNVFLVTFGGIEYEVRWNQDYDDYFTYEWHIKDENGDEVDDEDIINTLIEFCTPKVKLVK